MITIRKSDDRGHFDHGWLDTRHTFSFGDYWDPAHVSFRALRVLNEDRVVPAAGFGTHGHNDMEIVSYVLSGRLAHKDSLGTGSTIVPGDVQYMSAGTGVKHSEFNDSKTDPVHFVQIWIVPDRRGYEPRYGEKTFAEAEKRGKLRLVASGTGDDGSIQLRQDVNLYATILRDDESAPLEIGAGRHLWVQVLRGEADVNGHGLAAGDGLAASDETSFSLRGAGAEAELLVFDLA
ncbi:MAG TPA: pirin family protein [Thermoanaerobaculia bacterium]|nr:pirin family protein [Thermoanaerobaculia bacterium]